TSRRIVPTGGCPTRGGSPQVGCSRRDSQPGSTPACTPGPDHQCPAQQPRSERGLGETRPSALPPRVVSRRLTTTCGRPPALRRGRGTKPAALLLAGRSQNPTDLTDKHLVRRPLRTCVLVLPLVGFDVASHGHEVAFLEVCFGDGFGGAGERGAASPPGVAVFPLVGLLVEAAGVGDEAEFGDGGSGGCPADLGFGDDAGGDGDGGQGHG